MLLALNKLIELLSAPWERKKKDLSIIKKQMSYEQMKMPMKVRGDKINNSSLYILTITKEKPFQRDIQPSGHAGTTVVWL